MIQQKKAFSRWIITLADIGIIILAYWLAVLIRAGLLMLSESVEIGWYLSYYVKIFPFFLITFIPIIILNNSSLQYFPVDKYKFYTRTISSLVIALLISTTLLYYFKLFTQSRIALFLFFIISTISMLLLREFISRRRNNCIRTLILGPEKEVEEIKKVFSIHAFFGIDILEVLKEVDENFIERLKSESVDWVIVLKKEFKSYIPICENLGITVSYYLKGEFKELSSFVSVEQMLESPLLTFHPVPPQYIQLFLKYTVDKLLAFILIILFSPLFVVIPIIIKLTSRGPVLYRHQRSGLNGRRFMMLKFRTMFEKADEMKELLIHKNEMKNIVFKMREDPRITKSGRILRQYSLDELPQLINVLKGEMSLVGPRPPLPEEVEKYEGWERKRLSMKPGLTCLWQISGRSDIGFEEWMKLDLEYMDNWSPILDLVILLKTIPAVISGRGAY